MNTLILYVALAQAPAPFLTVRGVCAIPADKSVLQLVKGKARQDCVRAALNGGAPIPRGETVRLIRTLPIKEVAEIPKEKQ